MKKSLLSLAFGTFALGIVEFGMMGILSDIASDLGISITEAGHLISAYSAGVAVGAPSLLFLRKLPLRRLMLLLAAVITAGNALVAVSPNYGCLLAARFIAGLPHGAFFGAGAIVCSRLADKGKGASAVAVLIGGMTVANLVGVLSIHLFVPNSLVAVPLRNRRRDGTGYIHLHPQLGATIVAIARHWRKRPVPLSFQPCPVAHICRGVLRSGKHLLLVELHITDYDKGGRFLRIVDDADHDIGGRRNGGRQLCGRTAV